MNSLPLELRCPACGSVKVAYSCEPECCFNHVCEDCLASFQVATRDLGQMAGHVIADGVEVDSCSPTASCARCHSLRVRSIDRDAASGRAVCIDCQALLELVLE